ncbi:hypothetical protein EC991_006359 [Linnemannia zychae]|nr:hypothetical protein EC991_006359 [Linnemannia zychae]
MHHALQLFEIKSHIRNFLKVKDLKQCILVCRDWWFTFEPLICREVGITYYLPDPLFGPRGPPADDDDEAWEQLNYDQEDAIIPRQPSAFSLVRHRLQVRCIDSYAQILSPIPFRNLRTVVLISGSLSDQDLTPWTQFLRGCRESLQELELGGYRVLPLANFWKTLMDLPRLRSLMIVRGWLEEKEQIVAFWKLCSKLESLKIRSVHFPNVWCDNYSYPVPDLSNMKELLLWNMEMQFDRQARIVAQCGQLQRLLWKGAFNSYKRAPDTTPLFLDFVSSGRLFNLKAVKLEHGSACMAEKVLSAWLKKVDCAQGMPWSPKILSMVHEHVPRLTELNVEDSADHSSRCILLLLASCPHLRTATVPPMKVSEMVALSPQGWPCTGLRRLSVRFEMDEVLGMDRGESNRFVLQLLSTLTELEVLILFSDRYSKCAVPSEPDEKELKMCLASGLDILAGLKYLRGLALPDRQPWTRAELDWVKEHWTRLTDLAGIQHNLNAEQGLEEELKRRGLLSVDALAPELDPVDLLSSIQVCRLWYQVQVPSLWSVIDESRYSWSNVLSTHDSVSIRTLFVKHGQYIRELNVHSQAMLDIVGVDGTCTKLRALRIYDITNKTPGMQYTDPSGVRGGLWAFVQANAELETLRFGSSVKALLQDAGASVREYTLTSLKNLVVLQDYTGILEPQKVMEQYPKIRILLGSLLDYAKAEVLGAHIQLRSLELIRYTEGRMFLVILNRLCNLEQLIIAGLFDTGQEFEQEAQELLVNPPLRLKAFTLRRQEALTLDHAMATWIIPSMPHLKEFSATMLCKETARALAIHATQLEVFCQSKDTDSIRPTSKPQPALNIANLLFQTCTKLRVFDGIHHKIEADKMTEQPWLD